MLLRKDAGPQIDYLEDWPIHYYEIESATEKQAQLAIAIEKQLDPQSDFYRKKLLEKRYFSLNKNGNADAFMHAWMMIKASAATGVSFFTKKKLERELLSYMDELCLYHYEPEAPEEKKILLDEWNDFARQFIASCVGSRTYCSTLFGFVPVKDAVVAKKLAEEIELVTGRYPAQLGHAEAFLPLREIFIHNYCQMIENGQSYWEETQINKH